MDHPDKQPTPVPDADSVLLQNLTIPISCTESWDDMKGSERVRHCGMCRKDVYNLSAMPRPEAAALLAGNVDGNLCVRFYRRGDGTVVTSDCGTSTTVKMRRMLGKMPRAARAAGVAGAAAIAVTAAHAMSHPQPVVVMMGAPPAMPVPVEKTPAPDGQRDQGTQGEQQQEHQKERQTTGPTRDNEA